MNIDETGPDGGGPRAPGDERVDAALVRITHDLNNVLQSIRSATEVLKLSLAPDHARAAATIEILKRNTETAALLTQKLMEISRAGPRVARPVDPSGNGRSAGHELLNGLKVMVVEDESLVAMHVEDLLAQMGARVIGMANSVEDGLVLAQHPDLGLALLDINLGGVKAFPVAEALEASGVPFVLMSGDSSLPERWRGQPAVQKPFELENLRDAMVRAVRARAAGARHDG